jgi:hypothetical protein
MSLGLPFNGIRGTNQPKGAKIKDMKNFIIKHSALAYCPENGYKLVEEDGKIIEETEGSDTISVPGKMEVCPRCNGIGRHDRDDIDCSKLVDNMREDGDEDGIEGYFRGDYDVICSECHGRNVIVSPAEDALPIWAANAMYEWDRQDAADRAYSDMERRMGA